MTFARSRSATWMKRPQPQPTAAVRLFCFAHSGADASVFRNWPEQLPVNIDVCAIQLPGREDRVNERPFVSFTALVETLAAVIDNDRPFAFFAYSSGALLAFEVARELRRRGRPEPALLPVSGSSAPNVDNPEPPISRLPDAQFVGELRRLNGTPEIVLRDAELMELLLPTLRADFALYESYEYVPEPPLQCPIVAFGGLDDARIPPVKVDQWSAHTSDRFPGTHLFIRNQTPVLMQAIGLELRRTFPRLRGLTTTSPVAAPSSACAGCRAN